MLSHSRTDIRAEDTGQAARTEDTNDGEPMDGLRGGGAEARRVLVARGAGPGPAALAGTGRTPATRRIIGLTAELAAELSHLRGTDLGTADVRGLMHGMNCTAAALTRILDQLSECPALAQPEDNELGLPRHHTVRSKLEQAAAAAEDLQTSAESLYRLLPADALGRNDPRTSTVDTD